MPKTEAVLQQLRQLRTEVEELENNEEKYWKQRSRADWLKDGDKNTNFFHKKASARRRRNMLRKLRDEEDRMYTRKEALFKCFTDYFTSMFTAGVAPAATLVVDSIKCSFYAEDN
ncbi:unnamed protein product [Linum trigynum]|uniref:Uncharacterized protein n=1 Tax=Linum trigynum TaxID=586398 RepID=A0AAV2DVZ0_9ROSI